MPSSLHAEIERKTAADGVTFQTRIRGANGEILVWTERYESHEAADHVLSLLEEYMLDNLEFRREYIGFEGK
jgi:uncharacterized protein YegP (UPF0339 family)